MMRPEIGAAPSAPLLPGASAPFFSAPSPAGGREFCGSLGSFGSLESVDKNQSFQRKPAHSGDPSELPGVLSPSGNNRSGNYIAFHARRQPAPGTNGLSPIR